MSWTDEEKTEVISAYQEANPTPETSKEIVSDIASKMGKSPNGVRMILVRSGDYITAEPTKGSSTKSSGSTRVSKQAAQESLAGLISSKGKEPDMEILGKLTGKACAYLVDVFND